MRGPRGWWLDLLDCDDLVTATTDAFFNNLTDFKFCRGNFGVRESFKNSIDKQAGYFGLVFVFHILFFHAANIRPPCLIVKFIFQIFSEICVIAKV